jgi:hypothetical protein
LAVNYADLPFPEAPKVIAPGCILENATNSVRFILED